MPTTISSSHQVHSELTLRNIAFRFTREKQGILWLKIASKSSLAAYASRMTLKVECLTSCELRAEIRLALIYATDCIDDNWLLFNVVYHHISGRLEDIIAIHHRAISASLYERETARPASSSNNWTGKPAEPCEVSHDIGSLMEFRDNFASFSGNHSVPYKIVREAVQALETINERLGLLQTTEETPLWPGWQTCIICQQNLHPCAMLTLDCGHCHYGDCVLLNLVGSINDSTRFPPRCCSQEMISFESFGFHEMLLPARIQTRIREMYVEHRTIDKVYCHVNNCSTFILPQASDRDCVICPKCRSGTCILCKGPYHKGRPCPPDKASKQVLDLVKKSGW